MSVFVSVSLAALAITLPPRACLAVHSAHARGAGSTAGSTAGSVSAAQSGCKSGAAQHSESVIRSVFISHLISFLNHGHLSGFDHFFTLRSDLLEHLEETEVLRETILK
jgi:hypothetical protein